MGNLISVISYISFSTYTHSNMHEFNINDQQVFDDKNATVWIVLFELCAVSCISHETCCYSQAQISLRKTYDNHTISNARRNNTKSFSDVSDYNTMINSFAIISELKQI